MRADLAALWTALPATVRCAVPDALAARIQKAVATLDLREPAHLPMVVALLIELSTFLGFLAIELNRPASPDEPANARLH